MFIFTLHRPCDFHKVTFNLSSCIQDMSNKKLNLSHNDETSEFSEVSWETARKANIYRNNLTCMKTFQQEFDDTHGYIYHHKCYINYTNIKSAGNLVSEDKQAKTSAASQHTPTMYMRRSSEKKDR